MTPMIALDLSLDGIVVMSRAPDGPDRGKWWREGVVRLDAEDMSGELRRMRALCAARVGEDFTSILVIPDSQLLFTSLERDDRGAKTTIRALLKGRTPYPVEELTFDFVQRGDRLQVAVVALDTLREAEAFAAGFGFRPVALIGNPRDSTFPGIPDFGRTQIAADLLAGEVLTLDLGEGVTVVPAPPMPEVPRAAPAARDPAPEPSAAPAGATEAFDSAAGGAPAPRAPPVPPKSTVPAGTPLPAQAGRPTVAPTVPATEAPEASDFAALMATAPKAILPEGDAARDARGDAVFSRHAKTVGPRPMAGPAFTTRRRAPAAEAPRTEPGLARITPRLFQPAADDGAPQTGEGGAEPRPPAPQNPAVRSEPPPEAPEPTKPQHRAQAAGAAPKIEGAAPPQASFRAAALSALAGRMGRAATGFDRASKAARSLRARRPSKGMSDKGRAETVDAQTPSVHAKARDRSASPRGKRAGGRLGLYLTLSLLAILGALAIWSVAFRSDDVAGLATSADAPAAVDLPPPAASGEVMDTDTAIADVTSPDAAAAPAQAPPTDDDLALLLPDSQGSLEATGLEAGPDDLADAPAGADPAADDPTAAEIRPEIAVVTTDAAPFELPRDIAAAPEAESANEIYVASIDPVIRGSDAVALPRAAAPVDAFAPQTSPAPAGTNFETGSDGLVVASAAGTLAPGGYSVIAGRPAMLPDPRPGETPAQQATQGAADDAARTELGRTRPAPRPQDAPERAERLSFNGLTREELTRVRPTERPAAISEAVVRAEAAATRQAASVQAAASAAVASLVRTEPRAEAPALGLDDAVSQSRYALAESRRPSERPRGVEQDAARIVTQRSEAAPAAAVASAASASQAVAVDSGRQTLRSAGGSVSRAATQSNQIRLREMNLIGVYGRPNARRALVRLSNGRYVKIEVGDRLERGRVTAIGESEVIYQQNGRNYAIRMPQT